MAVDKSSGVYDNNFGKRLAATDKKIREKAVDDLQIWTTRLTADATLLDLQKVWKAIFFCYWHSDKPLVQQELAERIAGLQHSFKTPAIGYRFLSVFYEMLIREWHGIDRLRLDKYYNLLRQQMRQSLVVALREGVSEELGSMVGEGEGVFSSSTKVPEGRIALRSYMVEYLFQELGAAVAEHPEGKITELTQVLVRTLVRFIASSVDKFAIKRVVDSVFEPLIKALERQTSGELDADSEQILNVFGDAAPLFAYMRELAESTDAQVTERGRYTLYKMCKQGRGALGATPATTTSTVQDSAPEAKPEAKRAISRPKASKEARASAGVQAEPKTKADLNAKEKRTISRTIDVPAAVKDANARAPKRDFDLVHLVCSDELNGKGFIKVAEVHKRPSLAPVPNVKSEIPNYEEMELDTEEDFRHSLVVMAEVTKKSKIHRIPEEEPATKKVKAAKKASGAATPKKTSGKSTPKTTPAPKSNKNDASNESKGQATTPKEKENVKQKKTPKSAKGSKNTPKGENKTEGEKKKGIRIQLHSNRTIGFMQSMSNLIKNELPFSPVKTPTRGILKQLPRAEDFF